MEIEQVKPKKLDSELSSNELSQKRTGLSEHRTHLSDARSHLANERTHLSYLRTGISLISFGVTLNRFSLFLIQNNEMPRFKGRSLLHDTTNVGIGMVVIGCLLIIWSIIHYIQTSKSIDNLAYQPSKWSVLTFSITIAVIGTAATAWMILG